MHTIYPIGMWKLGLLVPSAAINDPTNSSNKGMLNDKDDGDRW